MAEDEPPIDMNAILESQGFEDQNLEEIARHNDFKRGEAFKDHVSIAVRVLFWVAIAVILGMGITWTWHLLAPSQYHYLCEKNIDKIETILFSGALASIIPVYAKKYI